MSINLPLLVTTGSYVGAALVLLSFVATTTGRLSTTSRFCHLANIFGGGALLASCASQAAWPSAGLNLVWVLVSLGALAQAALQRRAGHTAVALPVVEDTVPAAAPVLAPVAVPEGRLQLAETIPFPAISAEARRVPVAV